MYRYTSKIIAIVMAAYGGLAVAQHQHAPLPVVQAPVAASPAQSMMAAPTGSPAASATRPVVSAIARYRRFDAAEPLADWRQVNKTVQEIGGWRAYAKEAAIANSAAVPAGGTK